MTEETAPAPPLQIPEAAARHVRDALNAVLGDDGRGTAPAETPEPDIADLPCSAAIPRHPHDAHEWEPQPGMPAVRCPGGWAAADSEAQPTNVDGEADELTAQEARDLADELGYDLYRAQDAVAFVGECCDIADREGRQITTGDVREWMKGARCARQLAADSSPSLEKEGGDFKVGAPVSWSVAGSTPVEHCGDLSSAAFTDPRTECSLRPGHSGSHADDYGSRWWTDPDAGDGPTPADLAAWEKASEGDDALMTAAEEALAEDDPPQVSAASGDSRRFTDADGGALRERIAERLRGAAYSCDCADCADPAVCDAAHPIQVGCWTHGRVSDISGPVDAITDVVMAAVTPALNASAGEAMLLRAQLATGEQAVEQMRARVVELKATIAGYEDHCRAERAEAALVRVRALHVALPGRPPAAGECAECGDYWPCDTIRALDNPAEGEPTDA